MMTATIEFPRKGVDGKCRSRAELEQWWLDAFSGDIITRLNRLAPAHKSFIDYLIDAIKAQQDNLLTASPVELDRIRSYVSAHYASDVQNSSTDLLNAFGYDKYRKDKLVEWSNMLNVKVCPYCNHEYTLYIGTDVKRSLHQYDHFYGKREYPYLSMSMYNLIPACSICNHQKSAQALDVKLNPYSSDISTLYTFRVANSYALRSGRLPSGSSAGCGSCTRADSVAIEIDSVGGQKDAASALNANFMLSGRFGRHLDVVDEIYSKVYCEPYYKHIKGIPSDMLSRLLQEWMNVPPLREDIEHNPLVKFRQDVLSQARREYRRVE